MKLIGLQVSLEQQVGNCSATDERWMRLPLVVMVVGRFLGTHA
jgi:hypothetical protein